MKKTLLILFVFGLVLTGCKDYKQRWNERKNTEKKLELRLSVKDYPFKPGDIVSLKPDRHKAVIAEVVGFESFLLASTNPSGLYEVKYDSTGKDYTRKKLIKITNIKYKVRYKVRQEHQRSYVFSEDEPTDILHYKERIVNWYEIYGKVKKGGD